MKLAILTDSGAVYLEFLKMGNRFHSLFSSEPRNPELVKTEPISTKSKDRIFKSERLSAAIKYNKTDVKEGSDKFSKNEANMELLSRQTTAISREAMKETLIMIIGQTMF